MKNLLQRFIREEEGQDLIEYALLMGLIAVICILAITAGGKSISTIWNQVSSALGVAAT